MFRLNWVIIRRKTLKMTNHMQCVKPTYYRYIQILILIKINKIIF
jgi:hypothetical protein